MNLISPLRLIGRRPYCQEGLDNWTERRELRDKEDSGARVPLMKPLSEAL